MILCSQKMQVNLFGYPLTFLVVLRKLSQQLWNESLWNLVQTFVTLLRMNCDHNVIL